MRELCQPFVPLVSSSPANTSQSEKTEPQELKRSLGQWLAARLGVPTYTHSVATTAGWVPPRRPPSAGSLGFGLGIIPPYPDIPDQTSVGPGPQAGDEGERG